MSELDQKRRGALNRPRRADGVETYPPAAESAPWVVRRGESYLRVGADLARLLDVLDGLLNHSELAEALGPRWDTTTVGAAVDRLYAADLIADGSRRRLGKKRRVKFVPPLTIQVTVIRPARLLTVLSVAGRGLANRMVASTAALIAVFGLVALGAMVGDAFRVLSRPLPWQSYLGLLVAGVVSTTLHELGHGTALLRQGGRPSRLGVMVFYLVPAMFCDVSDAWRLSRPRQRVKVALAGIFVHAVLGGIAVLASFLPMAQPQRAGLIVFAIASYLAGLLNLIPFVKFDGYLALMSYLDRPNLRDDAISDSRRALVRALFGGRTGPRKLPDLSWAVPYGLGCQVFPVVLVIAVLRTYSDLLGRIGVVGAVVVVAIVGYVAVLAIRGTARLLAIARRSGAGFGRIAGVMTGSAGLLVAALSLIPVSYTVPGGYVTTGGDTGYFATIKGTSMDTTPQEGSAVELYRSGIVLSDRQGSATVASSTAANIDAPADAFVPLLTPGDATLSAKAWPIDLAGTAGKDKGTAVVHLGDRPLGEWIYLTYLEPALP